MYLICRRNDRHTVCREISGKLLVFSYYEAAEGHLETLPDPEAWAIRPMETRDHKRYPNLARVLVG